MEKLFAKNILDPETEVHYNFINQIESAYDIHTHDFFEIFLVVCGDAVHHINDDRQILLEGAMVFIRPADIHYYKKHSPANCQFINLAFSANTLEDFFDYLGDKALRDKLLSCPLPPLSMIPSSDLLTAKHKLEALALIPREDKHKIKSYLRILLADFMFNYFAVYDKMNTGIPGWLNHLVYEMKKKENFAQGIPAMQKLSNKSHEYTSHVFKKFFEKTPTEFINELRLNYAANMLVHSDKEIIDIALEAGFNNLSHFYHLFKKQYRVSPLQYRKAGQSVRL